MDQTILEWLLEEETPEVRLRTLKEYLKLPDDDERVIECKPDERIVIRPLTLHLTAMITFLRGG